MYSLTHYKVRFCLFFFFVLSTSSSACDDSFQSQPSIKLSKQKLNTPSGTYRSKQAELPKLIAASTATSPLVKGLFQQVRGGRNLKFELRYNIDHAVAALNDQKVIAAFQINRPQTTNKLNLIKVAKTNLWWASKQALPRLTQQEWKALLTNERTQLPNGKGFQLCLRAEPDRLEKLWIELNPEDKVILRRARQSGQWPIFSDEASLLEHLNRRPEAVALFAEGNLKLKGAPFSQIRFIENKSTEIQAELHLTSLLTKDQLPQVLKTLLNTLSNSERENAVQEWGWNP